MKKFPSLLLFAGALLFPCLLSAANFEGKVTMLMKPAKGDPMPINYSIKEGYMRVDMTGKDKKGNATGMGSFIYDVRKQEIIILMEGGGRGEKMYMVRPMPKPEDMPQQQTKQGKVSFERTGVTEKILGYTCEKCVVKSEDNPSTVSEVWITDQLGNFMGMNAGGNPMARGRGSNTEQAWEKALMGKNAFPLRTVVSKDGKEEMRMEVTAIDKQSLPDSLFIPGPEYKKFEMPNMGDMMRGMIPGR